MSVREAGNNGAVETKAVAFAVILHNTSMPQLKLGCMAGHSQRRYTMVRLDYRLPPAHRVETKQRVVPTCDDDEVLVSTPTESDAARYTTD